MTTDSALSHHSTESLVLATKRRFFPFKIPNFHQQLRHYISTADADRIYLVADRVIYSIHISSQKRETIAVIPFEPKCLTAGYGWIGVGGSDNGECAFVRIADRTARGDTSVLPSSDVDSALPINLEPPTRLSPPWPSRGEPESTRQALIPLMPEVQLHKFGGSIVNSVTVHRLPGADKGFADEDIMILSNNDKTVTIYSLTRSKVLKVLPHQACMNYAIMSPDSTLLAAVGDETRAYFYDVTCDYETTIQTDNGEKLPAWDWDLIRCIEMDIGTRFDDGCCFTVAFSPFSRLCAIGSQSGVITVFDVATVRDTEGEADGKNAIICNFNSSRPCCNGGAVRCMAFAPEPWDLLVWLEDKGRAGVADVRQAFIRRQILNLDMNDPNLEEVYTEPILNDPEELESDLDGRVLAESRHGTDATHRAILDSIERTSNERGNGADHSPLRESLIQDLTQRERLIVEFLNTARWTSRLEEGLTERRARVNASSHPTPRSQFQASTEGTRRPSRPTSPPHRSDALIDTFRENYLGHAGISSRNLNAGRDNHVTPPRGYPEGSRSVIGANVRPQPSLTLSWTASPSELQSATFLDHLHPVDRDADGPSSSSSEEGSDTRTHDPITRPSATVDHSSSRLTASDSRHDLGRLSTSELRTNVAAERLRRQRQIINEAQNRNSQREQRYRQQLLGFEQTRSPRWIRSVLNELPDRSLGPGARDQESGSTAGLGFGADGRTLYIATVDGIFEFQINTADRKTFPVMSYR
ncbi:hypothetical protein KXV74_006140 [Aspergillus fumigatus]|nr:hypothetical protein KXX09_008878 [Aspergillus fumigatus]KAH1927929.1 hypothetical protein KXW47_007644 [Aspergillus fumigatus]KAH2020456.1 hypothetical protein KXV45_002874 [Aspergillus fumigatus]KAH2024424.1 hypothetical protein KXV43_001353 [Aspergillus fumigatus]KAH2175908.1 hypothetical protein KXV74_006140 [Aspergillus fumigatus]